MTEKFEPSEIQRTSAPNPHGASPLDDPAPNPGPITFPSVEAPPETLPAGPDRPKPLLARLLNALGIPSGPTADWALDWVQVLGIAGLLAWATMSYVIVRMQVPTGSMEPTIMPGDSFFVDQISYDLGLKRPRPGDIIVFWHYESTPSCRDGFLLWHWGTPHGCAVRYVKRLIAVGGQTVQLRGGQVIVNGAPLSGPAFNRSYDNKGTQNFCVIGAASGEHCYLSDPQTVVTVPEGYYFALGDNTENSSDSRYWGFLKSSDFIGEPFLRVWPPNRLGFMNAYYGSLP